ncbi:hypothetical protein [Aeromonas hydrophila]|uniref:hypothetical protein n=1 Tax=Aeromonas hydrophila TaxID=644 RepID=UPI0035BA5090
MEQELVNYINWYKAERNKFCANVYIDKSSWLKEKLLPYSKWDSADVLEKESEFALKSIAKLQEKNFSKNSISLVVLTLNNRVEYISDQSDFYVTYAALMVFTLTVIGLSIGLIMKIIVTLLMFCGIIYSLSKRIELRKEVAISKEMINIFKQLESKHA